jgi:hypothetical protein
MSVRDSVPARSRQWPMGHRGGATAVISVQATSNGRRRA